MRIPMHVFGLLISLRDPANSLFVRDKYITLAEKRLHAGDVQKADVRKTYHLIAQLAANNRCVWFNGEFNSILSATCNKSKVNMLIISDTVRNHGVTFENMFL